MSYLDDNDLKTKGCDAKTDNDQKRQKDNPQTMIIMIEKIKDQPKTAMMKKRSKADLEILRGSTASRQPLSKPEPTHWSGKKTQHFVEDIFS